MSKFGIKRTKVRRVLSETKEEYAAAEASYFRGMGDAKRPGLSAADAAIADKHLPTKQKEQELLDWWEKGLTKSSRSGAFSKASTGFAIRPSGGRFASDFVDKCTPGHFKQPESRPVPKEQTRKVDVPPAAVTITHLCIDCLGLVNENDASTIVPSLFIMTSQDFTKLFSMGVQFGDIVLAVEHVTCLKEAQKMGQDRVPLALVRGGNITDPKDLALAAKHGFIERMHDGHEVTLGQFYLQKRKDRLEEQLHDVLICMDKASEAYRKNRIKE